MGSRWAVALLALLAALPARGAEYARGDYRFSTGDAPSFVRIAEVPKRWPADAPGADDQRWRYWLYDVQVDHRGGGERTYYDHVYEVRAPSLIGDGGRFEIGFRPEYQSLAIHRVEVRRDGVWSSRLKPERISLARREGEFENDIANGTVSALVVMDDVRIGDLVRIAYSIDGANPVLSGQALDGYSVGYQNPMLDTRWRGIYDAGTTLDVRSAEARYRPTIDTRGAGVEATFQRHGVAAIVNHGNYPIGYSPFPRVRLARAQTWREVVGWAQPLYPVVTDPLPADLESRIAQWRGLATAPERLTAALRAIQDEVRYFGIEMGEGSHRPHAPSETWSRRFGDCKDKAYLLSVVLRRLGIDAEPALVSAGSGKAIAEFPPSAAAFDHVIVRAHLDGEDIWLDPTIAQQGGDPRRADLSYLGVGLPIVSGTMGLVAIPAPRQAEHGVEMAERFAAGDGKSHGTLTVETVYRGGAADAARRSLLGERIEDVSRRYLEYYRKRYANAEVATVPVLEDDRAANLVRVREQYRLVDGLAGAAGRDPSLDLFAEALDKPTALPGSMSHPGPLRVGTRGTFRYRAEIDAPPAWSPRFGAESAHHESPAFKFDRAVSLDGNRAVLDYELQVLADDVGPADVARHLAELKQARDDLYSTLRYHAPETLQPREREDRLKALLRDAMKPKEAP